MNQLLCNKNYKNFRKDMKDGGCNSFTVYRDSSGVVHSDGDLDHESLATIMKSILARERLKSSPELPPIPAPWGDMQQSDVRSYAAKVIDVFKQPGQKYGFDDMPLWDINVTVNDLDKESRKVIVLQGVPQLSSHFVLVVCCASHASPIIKWSIYFFSWIKIYAKNGITLKN